MSEGESRVQRENVVTLIISDLVKRGQVEAYEAWVKGISEAVSGFEGFLGTEIIRPGTVQDREYVVIIRFMDYSHLRVWEESDLRRDWLERSKGIFSRPGILQKARGMELWFSLPGNANFAPKPAFHKQLTVSVLTVYPLIVGSGLLLRQIPGAGSLPTYISLFFSVILVSALMTWPVMPWISKKLEPWLYPEPEFDETAD
jgi:antibiotic biosynthesis monooxygenase (ABM) superfamily enzyme